MSTATDRLKNGEIVLIDGEMSTAVMNRRTLTPDAVGTDQPGRVGLVNIEEPELIRQLHLEYIEAGAEVILTNTFVSGEVDMKFSGLLEYFEESNGAGVQAAIDARERAGKPAVDICGTMACTTGYGSRIGTYTRQAEILAEAGVDLIAVEMIGSLEEGRDAIAAVRAVGLPVWVGVSAIRKPDGTLVTEAGDVVDKDQTWARAEDLRRDIAGFAALDIDALTIMHTLIEDTEEALAIVKAEFDGPFGAYPHQGDFAPPNWERGPTGPEAFAAVALQWVESGAQIIGGCCGIEAAHIAATRDALRKRAVSAA